MNQEMLYQYPGAIRPQDELGLAGVYSRSKTSVGPTLGFLVQGVCHMGEDVSRIAVNNGVGMKWLDGKGYTPYAYSAEEIAQLGRIWSGVGVTRYRRFEEILEEELIGEPVIQVGEIALATEERFARTFGDNTSASRLVLARKLKDIGKFPSFMLLTSDALVLGRGTDGNEPMTIGEKSGVFAAASEDGILSNLGYENHYYLAPGEMAYIDTFGLRVTRIVTGQRYVDLSQYTHNLRGDSNIDGVNIREGLWAIGQVASKVLPIEGDIVLPILRSGYTFGHGYAEALGIDFRPYLTRNRYQTTSGMGFDQLKTIKKTTGFLTFTVQPQIVDGKKVIVTDNGINTGDSIIESSVVLARAGAKSIDYVIATPPLRRLYRDGRSHPADDFLVSDIGDLEEEILIRLEHLGLAVPIGIHCLSIAETLEGLSRVGVNPADINVSRYLVP